MPRRARKDLDAQFLHIMIQGVNKEYIFKKEKYIKMYLNIFNNYIKQYEITLISYCIMNNHAHFLVYVKNIQQLGKFMQKVNLVFSQKYNELENRVGVIFRNRYKAEAIYDKKYLINCIKYIHNNPVKAKMVKKCEEYSYSSYNDYKNCKGIAISPIMKKIFGKDYNYLKVFEDTYDKLFMDDYIDDIDFYINERN